jgi:hypothetical protein
MLLPTEGIGVDRALLTVGGTLLSLLDSPASVTELWERFSLRARPADDAGKVTFDWFALALSMLFALRAVSWNEAGQLVKCHVSS